MCTDRNAKKKKKKKMTTHQHCHMDHDLLELPRMTEIIGLTIFRKGRGKTKERKLQADEIWRDLIKHVNWEFRLEPAISE